MGGVRASKPEIPFPLSSPIVSPHNEQSTEHAGKSGNILVRVYTAYNTSYTKHRLEKKAKKKLTYSLMRTTRHQHFQMPYPPFNT